VSTSAARYQQLSLNPSKLAGQCGKLKCCLNYELDQYAEALKDLPSTNVKLKLPKGIAVHFKTDIFKKTLYYIYDGQPGEPPFPLSSAAVKEIIEMNKKGIVIEDVEDFIEEAEEVMEETDFAQVVGQDSLTRFDQKRRGNKNRGRGGQNRGRGNAGGAGNSNAPRPQGQGAPKPAGEGAPQNRPPQNRDQQNRPQNRPQNKEQGPKPQGQPRPQGPRPQGEQGSAPQGGPRPEGQQPSQGNRNRNNNNRNRGPRKDQPNNGGPKPEGGAGA
jgi:hypothetical protein